VDLLLKVHQTVLESIGEGARLRMEFGAPADRPVPADPATRT